MNKNKSMVETIASKWTLLDLKREMLNHSKKDRKSIVKDIAEYFSNIKEINIWE